MKIENICKSCIDKKVEEIKREQEERMNKILRKEFNRGESIGFLVGVISSTIAVVISAILSIWGFG